MIRKALVLMLAFVMVLTSFTFSLAANYNFGDKTLEELEEMLKDEQDKDQPNEKMIEKLEEAIEEFEEEDQEDDEDQYEYLEEIDDLDQLEDILEQALEDEDMKLASKVEKRIARVEREQHRESWESEKDEFEALKDAAEAAKDEAEEAYEEAVADGSISEEELEELWNAFLEAKEDFEEAREAFKDSITERRAEIQNRYTVEEKKALKEAEKAIRKGYPDDSVIPYDSIFSDDYEFKFDTPPVIRSGRTLIPVRAITEGFGCTVEWDAEDQEVTITKPDSDIEIVIELETGLVFVDGEEVEVDVPGSIMNNRTYVPLRFILETFGLKVKWDSDNEVIEIENE